MLSKSGVVVLLATAAAMAACQTTPNDTTRNSADAGESAFSGSALSEQKLAALQLRETETVNTLLAEGELRYRADDNKKNGLEYCSISLRYARRGEFRQAVRAASKALFLGERSGNDWVLAHAHRDLGYAYSLAGFLEKAEDFSLEAIDYADSFVASSSNPERAEAIYGPAYKVLGDVSLRRGDANDAIANYEKSRSEGRRKQRPEVDASLGNAYLNLDQLDKAQAGFTNALKTGSPRVRLMAMRGLGKLEIARGNLSAARKWFDKAVANAVNNSDQQYQQIWSYHEQGRAILAQGDKAGALDSYGKAVTVAEKLRARFHSEEFRTGFFSNIQDIYDEYIDLLSETSNLDTAFAVSEKSRARAMLDLVGRRKFVSRDHRVFAETTSQSTEISALQSVLPPRTAMVLYHLTAKSAYAWVIDRSNRSLVKLEGNREHYKILAKRFRKELSVRSIHVHKLSAELYDGLVKPLRLGSTDKLIIVPHSDLHYIPFQALLSPSGYFVENASISYAVSASMLHLQLSESKRTQNNVLAFGNPDLGSASLALPAAEEEVVRIGKLFKSSQVFKLKEATKDKFLDFGPDSNVIHVAAHAELDELDPLYSTIYFSPRNDGTGYLEAHELYRLKLPHTQLITLSACETGLGSVTAGDEMWGFMRSVLSTGATTVLMSLWAVDDAATKDLMVSFYEAGRLKPTAEAIRHAQIELIKSGKYRHPFYWAPFNLVGDPR